MAKLEVFADTSAIYALVNRKDPSHDAAKAEVEKLLRGGRRLVTTDYVVTESINLGNARGGSVVALRVLDLVEQSQALKIEWVGVERFEVAKRFFRKHSDHGYSFTDCTSFVVMQEFQLTDALTTDRHFRSAGFHVLLPSA